MDVALGHALIYRLNIQQRSTVVLTAPSAVCKARNTTSLVYFPVWVSWAEWVLGTFLVGLPR